MKRHAMSLLFLLLLAAAPAAAQQQPDDPFLWLEEVESERSLAWVEARNAATLEALRAHPAFDDVRERALEVLNSDDRIAYPSIMGEHLYNFWRDDEHERGIWRRTTWDAYLAGDPAWETILDIDALAAAEDVNWDWGGATCRAPEYRICMVRLSRGGADAVEIREFDIESKRFVEGGFFLPEAKQSVAWYGPDALLVATDFGPGSMTTSGYARIAKLWQRGEPLEEAETLFEGKPTDVSVGVFTWRTADDEYSMIWHSPRFFESTTYLIEGDSLVEIELPMDADMDLVRDQMVVYVRSPWKVGGTTYQPGTLIAMPFADFMAGERDFTVVLAPGERQTIDGTSTTRDYLLVSLLDNVRGELWRYRYADGRWVGEKVPAPDMGDVDVASTSSQTNRFFFTYEGFTKPTSLYLTGEAGTVREVRSLPEMFEADDLVVEQHEATSKDGTRIPYFVVRPEDVRLDGENPTLLYAYGGFEVSRTPGYSATVGSLWLERGNVYVLANIRGGGEFGPEWHRAAMKENRQRAFDDFIAVAEDLIARGVTSPDHLGIMGGSNGGLLVGATFTQRPELFDAVVAQVPLLDMKRYHKLLAGASWMAEYGNPDIPEQWAYIREYSPYQNVHEGVDYPRVLFTTTTRDDRVHPGHARKMAAKMMAQGHPIYFFENTEGGHGSGVTSEQRALMYAVVYTYLLERLADDEPTS